MTAKKVFAIVLAGLAIVAGLFVFQRQVDDRSEFAAQSALANEHFKVYKTATCGCCGNYVDYLRKMGFQVSVNDLPEDDLNNFKHEQGVPHDMYSCHTTLVGNYVVEGHIPIEAIEKMFQSKADFAGIAMPGMPSGSPGMGGGKKEQFEIFSLNDGAAESWIKL